MKPIRLAAVALVSAVAGGGAAYAQSPAYGPHQAPPPAYGDHRYDDHDGDDRGYDRDRGDDRRYDTEPSPRMDVGFFYEELSPYGDWVLTRAYGWAWFPRYVRPYWRPYLEGRWVSTEYGWTWVSYEPFGWATYHYGRWAWDSRFGWLWIPGTIWGPAWVSWQHGGGYVGWAPLPPAVGFEIGVGFRLGGFDLRIGIQPDAYSFVPERSFLDNRLSSHRVPTARNVTLFRNTTNVTDYGYSGDRIVNRGVAVRRIEQATGRQVRQHRVTEARERTRTEVTASEVRVFKPERRLLDAVRVGPRVNEGLRAELPAAGRDPVRPSAGPRDLPDVVVAPRAARAPRPQAREIDQQDRRERLALERYQASEKQRIEKLQRDEIAKARAKADREKIQQGHQAERQALRQQQQDAANQLAARQRVQREAALAKPILRVAPPAANPADDAGKDGKEKDKNKGKSKDKDNDDDNDRDRRRLGEPRS